MNSQSVAVGVGVGALVTVALAVAVYYAKRATLIQAAGDAAAVEFHRYLNAQGADGALAATLPGVDVVVRNTVVTTLERSLP